MAKKRTNAVSRSLAAYKLQNAGVLKTGATGFLRFRSDILNLLLGGIQLESITELAGDPELFKSTIAAEVACDALAMGAVVVVHDKERKLGASRFSSLGVDAYNHDNFFPHRDRLPEYRITVQAYFRDMLEIVSIVRSEDLAAVHAEIRNPGGDPEVWDYYCTLVEGKPGARGVKRAEAIVDALKFPTSLRPQDRRIVLSILDSTTSVPSDTEVPVMSDDGSYEVTSPKPAQQAAAWSEEMRRCVWLDDRVACLHLAQKRMHIDLRGGVSYSKASVTTAQTFYASNRLVVRSLGKKGALFRDLKTGGVLIGGKTTEQDRDASAQIGQLIEIKIHKDLTALKTSVPLFMLGATGTDRPNSLWEFLSSKGLIVHRAAGRWVFTADEFKAVFGEDLTFTRFDFINMYATQGAKLRTALLAYKSFLSTGIREDLTDLYAPPPPTEPGQLVEVTLVPAVPPPEAASPKPAKKKAAKKTSKKKVAKKAAKKTSKKL